MVNVVCAYFSYISMYVCATKWKIIKRKYKKNWAIDNSNFFTSDTYGTKLAVCEIKLGCEYANLAQIKIEYILALLSYFQQELYTSRAWPDSKLKNVTRF